MHFIMKGRLIKGKIKKAEKVVLLTINYRIFSLLYGFSLHFAFLTMPCISFIFGLTFHSANSSKNVDFFQEKNVFTRFPKMIRKPLLYQSVDKEIS